MKIRSGFVSNSSSSSFIIASDGDVNITFTLSLRELASSVVKTPQELDDYFTRRYDSDWIRDEWCKAVYRKSTKALNEGKTLYFGDISSDSDNALEVFLYEEGLKRSLPKEAILIQGD